MADLNERGGPGPAGDLRSYLAVLWRRKFVILPLVVVLPLTAYFTSEQPPPNYEASATVLLNRQSQGLAGVNDPTLWDPSRTVRTQAQIARLPEIAARVVRAAGLRDRDAGGFLANSGVDSDEKNDLLVLRARDADPALAVRLANIYAQKYIEYRRELDTQALREATRLADDQLRQMREQGIDATGTAYQALVQRQQQLQTAETLQASNALLVRQAVAASQTADGGRRMLMLALALGMIFGVGLAFLVEALDTRARSPNELAAALELQLLGALPPPRGEVRRRRGLVMLDEPNSAAAEPYRMLRASLDD